VPIATVDMYYQQPNSGHVSIDHHIITVLTCVGPGAKKGQLDVTFFVEEKGRLNLGVSAHAGTQSGDAVSST